MNIKHYFTIGLLALSVFGFACSAAAGVMEDIQAENHKIKPSTKTIQDATGRYYKSTTMTIYQTKVGRSDVYMYLVNADGERIVRLDYYYFGREWQFVDYFSIGNGSTVRILQPQSLPKRKLYSGPYIEEYMSVSLTEEDLQFMKSTLAFRVVSSSKGYYPVNFLKPKKSSLSLYQACEYALKFLKEK